MSKTESRATMREVCRLGKIHPSAPYQAELQPTLHCQNLPRLVVLCATRNLSVMVFLEMCGRFTLKSPGRRKFDRLNHPNLPPLFPRYNIAPSQSVLAIVQRGVERGAVLLQWGLVPSWTKEPKGFINARSETIEEKPSFSESFQKRRCLVLADGFFESDKKSGKLKQPYYFQIKNETSFAFAGIWDEWRRDKVSIASCAIVTTLKQLERVTVGSGLSCFGRSKPTKMREANVTFH